MINRFFQTAYSLFKYSKFIFVLFLFILQLDVTFNCFIFLWSILLNWLFTTYRIKNSILFFSSTILSDCKRLISFVFIKPEDIGEPIGLISFYFMRWLMTYALSCMILRMGFLLLLKYFVLSGIQILDKIFISELIISLFALFAFVFLLFLELKELVVVFVFGMNVPIELGLLCFYLSLPLIVWLSVNLNTITC